MDVVFITTTSEKLDSVPVIDGQIIALSDVDAYLYDQGGVRRAASQHNVVTTLPSVGIQGSTYIVTEGDISHPKGMYVWANDNWIDVIRLCEEVVTLTVTPDYSYYRSSRSKCLGEFIITRGILAEGKDAYISAVQQGKIIRFKIKWEDDASTNATTYADTPFEYIFGKGEYVYGTPPSTFIYPTEATAERASGVSETQVWSESQDSEYPDTIATTVKFLLEYDPVNDLLQIGILQNDDILESRVFYNRLNSQEFLTSTEDKTIIGGIEELAKKKEIVRLTTSNYSATLPDCPEGSWPEETMSLDVTIPQDIDFDFSDDALAKYTPVLDNGTTYIGKTELKTATELAPVASESPTYHTFVRHWPSNDRIDIIQILSISGKTCTAVMTQQYSLMRNQTYPILDTEDQSILGAINEAYNKTEVKEIKILAKSSSQPYTNQFMVALDVSEVSVTEGQYMYLDNLDSKCIARMEDGTYFLPMEVPVMHYAGMLSLDNKWEGDTPTNGDGLYTFVGFVSRSIYPDSEYPDEVKDVGGPSFVTLQLMTELNEYMSDVFDEEWINKGYYYGYLTFHTMFLDKHAYHKLNTTNKQLIPAINEVYEKATAAATSANSLVIPVTSTAGSVEELSSGNMTIDPAFTNSVIIERMTETTEVYMCIALGDDQIWLQLGGLNSYFAEPMSIDMDSDNVNTLSFYGFHHAGPNTVLDITTQVYLYPGVTSPVLSNTFVNNYHSETLETFDLATSTPDWNTYSQDIKGHIDNRTHYLRYTNPTAVTGWEDPKQTTGSHQVGNGRFIVNFPGTGDSDFTEIGKTYRIELTADVDGTSRTFEMFGKGVAGVGELAGYNVIGCANSADLEERTKDLGMRTFSFYKYNASTWTFVQSENESILAYLSASSAINSVKLKIEEVTEEVVPLDPKYLPEADIKNWAKEVVDSQIVELTQAEYDQLTEDEKHNGKIYMITDEVSTETAVVDIIKENVVQISQSEYDVLTPEQQAAKKYIVTSEPLTQSQVEKIVSDMHVRLTQDEYDALSEEEKNNGKIYMVTDGDGSSSNSGSNSSDSAGTSSLTTLTDGYIELMEFGKEKGLVDSLSKYKGYYNQYTAGFSTDGPTTTGTYRVDVEYLILAKDGTVYENKLSLPAIFEMNLVISDNFYVYLHSNTSLIQTQQDADNGSIFEGMGTTTAFIHLDELAFDRPWSTKVNNATKSVKFSPFENEIDVDGLTYQVKTRIVMTLIGQ